MRDPYVLNEGSIPAGSLNPISKSLIHLYNQKKHVLSPPDKTEFCTYMNARKFERLVIEDLPKKHRVYKELEDKGKLVEKRCTWPALAILEAIYPNSHKELKELRKVIKHKYDEPTLRVLDPTFFLQDCYTKHDQDSVVKKATIIHQGEFMLLQSQSEGNKKQLWEAYNRAVSDVRGELQSKIDKLQDELSSLRGSMNKLTEALSSLSSGSISAQLALLNQLKETKTSLSVNELGGTLHRIEN